MTLLGWMLKKLRRRNRRKGVVAEEMNRPGRNFKPTTAVDIWEQKYRFRETPAKRAGTKRRLRREKLEKRGAA